MHYYQIHQLLKHSFDEPSVHQEIPELSVSLSHYAFTSQEASCLLSGSEHLYCKQHQVCFQENPRLDAGLPVREWLDSDIHCNQHFQYHIIKESSLTQASGVIFLFHGLNEKKWDKYLPWAYGLARRTHKAVLLFPIAFHMDRAPERWARRNEMYPIALNRADTRGNTESSFVNAAISTRLEQNPLRIFWSGLQTYSDIINLMTSIRSGSIDQISGTASIDLFGYSIGSFLSMILMMANPGQLLSRSRLFCFCGGMTLDRMYPISKYIMDAHAAIELQKSFATLLHTGFSENERLAHYLDSSIHQDESWFKVMLRYNYYQEQREKRIAELQDRLKALVLKKDMVTPPVEALNTLKGGFRDICTEVQVEDFTHPYSHMNPFPLTARNAAEVDRSYHLLMDSASAFLY